LIEIMGDKIQKVEHANKENSIVVCFVKHRGVLYDPLFRYKYHFS